MLRTVMLCGYSVIIAMLLVLISGASVARADESPPDVVRNPEPAFMVRAQVNRPTCSYREGDYLQVTVTSERDAYLYVFYQQADGKTNAIFPNRSQKNNRVAAGESVQIPSADDLFRWQIGAPYGKEFIKVVAAERPLEAVELERWTRNRFAPVSDKDLNTLNAELAKNANQGWAESQLTLHTYARAVDAPRSGERRFGVFFGVSNYRYHDQLVAASQGKATLNVQTPADNARKLGELFAELGRLDEHKICVNENATRANLEDAVTNWLPSVSRPGDTVFFLFSGHGSQIKDDNGDEPDGLDEVLVPHDIVELGILSELSKTPDATKQSEPRFTHLIEVAQRAGSDGLAMSAALMRETGVSDDLFARWLQDLDGRRVVVFLDTCHSGGFATHEKSPQAEPNPTPFDFLDGEFTRLKDIGQSNQALVAAAQTQQSALEIASLGMSVMSYFLYHSLHSAQGALTLEEGFDNCELSMREFFTKVNAERQKAGVPLLPAHQPYMVNQCQDKVYLKP